MTLPVLWICGPPGVGKSTVGWEVRQRIAAGGADLAYVDVDQLGICYPEPEGDPSRTRLQARVLARMIDGFAAEGASGVVVSGVTDSESGPHGDLLPNAELTVIRLDADAATLRARLTGRGSDDLVDGALRDAATLAASTFADRVVTTTGVDVGGVVDQIVADVADVAGLAGWPGSGTASGAHALATVAATPDLPPGASTGRILLLSGPTGVGKSTIGFPVFLQSLGSGVPTAYLDLDQLSFVPPAAAPACTRAAARHAAAAWAEFRAVGAQRLVVVGPVDDAALAAYAAAFAPSEVTLVRLRVAPEEHTARVLSRGAGGSWAQPGDPLRGLPEARLREVAADAVRDAAVLDATAPGVVVNAGVVDTVVVDTTGRAAWDVATELTGFWS